MFAGGEGHVATSTDFREAVRIMSVIYGIT